MSFSCTICTDIFVSSDDIHFTPCGHAFHYACILQWLERSKSCPECRNKCIAKSLTKVYLNHVTNIDNPSDNATLLQNLDNMKLSLREKDTKLKKLEETQEAHKGERKKMKKVIASLEGKINGQDCVLSTLRHEIGKLRAEQTEHQKLKEEMKKMENKMQLMKTIEFAIGSTSKEIEDMVASNSNPHTLGVLATSLKRELQASEFKRNELRERIKSCQNDLHRERGKCKVLEDKLSTADSEVYRLQREVDALAKKPSDSDSNSDASIILNTPDQPAKRKRKIDDLDMNRSTPIEDKVRNIIQSDSPFLPIKSSAFGLHPSVLRNGLSAAAFGKTEPSAKRTLTKAYSDLSDKYSSTKDMRPSENMPMPSSFGESLRKQNIPSAARIVKINRNGGSKPKLSCSDDLMLLDF